jgi:hypothetical protein
MEKHEREESAKSSVKDTLQLLIEEGLSKELGKGSKCKVKKGERKKSDHLDPPHSEKDCFVVDSKDRESEKKESVIDEDDFDYFFEFEDDDTAPSKRRKTLTMPDESKTWSVSKQLEWLSNHHNLQ